MTYIKMILFAEDLCQTWQKGVIAQLSELTGFDKDGIAEEFDEICPGWRGAGISSSSILQWCKLHGRGAAYYMEDRQLEVFPGKRPIVWSVLAIMHTSIGVCTPGRDSWTVWMRDLPRRSGESTT